MGTGGIPLLKSACLTASGGSCTSWDAGVGVGCSRCSGEWGEVHAAVGPTPAFPNVGSFLIKPEAQ